ncbi:MAG: 2-oxoacid:ferredoxin oxidoreductase subunit beta [bacterium]
MRTGTAFDDKEISMVIDRNSEQEIKSKASPKDYKSTLKPIWCAGCGNYGVLTALTQALSELGLPRHETAIITGIGCSSRIAGYLSIYGINTLHGRAIPIATGVKLANPELTVIAAGGDGDAFSIGGGHLPHVARKNIDLTYIVMDNRVYGLTKGQMSPTTPLDTSTASTFYGSYDPPVNMVEYMLSYGAGFVARGFAGNIKQLARLIIDGIKYPGFAFIQVLSPCITYRGKQEYDIIGAASRELPENYNPSDRMEAFRIAESVEELHMGVIYRNPDLIPYQERIESIRRIAKSKGVKPIERLIDEFRP